VARRWRRTASSPLLVGKRAEGVRRSFWEKQRSPQARVRVLGGLGGAGPCAWRRWLEHGGGEIRSDEGSVVVVDRAPA
jgi:hypothetical protein